MYNDNVFYIIVEEKDDKTGIIGFYDLDGFVLTDGISADRVLL